MKAIILAAGEGSRLRPLTNTNPKPLIKICGKTIIEHTIESIYNYVSEIIIVVKYKKEVFFDTLGDNYNGIKISYHEQIDKKGTAAAIEGIESDEDILIMNGDSIFDKEDLTKVINLDGYGCLVKKIEDPSKYGVFKEQNGLAKEIIEKPKEFISDLANLGVYKFPKEILDLSKKTPLSGRGEYEITYPINEYIKNNNFNLITIKGEFIDVGYPWDILTANEHFLNKLLESDIRGTVEDGVTIKGNIVLEEGSILKAGTYIEGNIYIGKNCSIGPNTYLRGSTVIGEDCRIGNSVEVKNSSLGNKTCIAHLSYVGDSIIGNNVNIAGGFISANVRHDKANIKVPIKGVLIDTSKRKLGVIIGDNTKTGIKSMSYPGRVLENDSFTLPGEVIK